jgi:hypothetical protein
MKRENALGYRLPPKLLTINAQTSMIKLDTIMSGTYHHPIFATCGIVTARRAVAPPGGWVISKSCMTTRARERETPAALEVRGSVIQEREGGGGK